MKTVNIVYSFVSDFNITDIVSLDTRPGKMRSFKMFSCKDKNMTHTAR